MRISVTLPLLAAAICYSNISALEIELRYNLDNTGFFDQPGAKEALQAAAAFYEEVITDELEAIDPGNFPGGVQRHWNPTYLEPGNGTPQIVSGANDLIVPANTIVIFAGARNLDTAAQGGPGGFQFLQPVNDAWINQVTNRGEEGATTYSNGSFSSNPSDFAPWGGTIFFDSSLTWNFSSTDATGPGIDFIPVALHELGHLLGLGNFGTFTSSWIPLLSGSRFQGPLSTTSNSNTNPSINGGIHWANNVPDSRTVAAFGRAHGELQKPLMKALVSSSQADIFAVPTDLDLAALRDIGWELVVAPENFQVELDFDPAAPAIEVPTSTGVTYQVSRAASPANLLPSGPSIVGDGSVQIWTDPAGSAQKAFYRVEALEPASASSRSKSPSLKKSTTITPEFSENGLPTLPPTQCQCVLH